MLPDKIAKTLFDRFWTRYIIKINILSTFLSFFLFWHKNLTNTRDVREFKKISTATIDKRYIYFFFPGGKIKTLGKNVC